jgi:aminopeptidase N
LESVWSESRYGKDQADYERWQATREWFGINNLWNKPIVRHDFDDSSEFDENAYGKGGWVLYMLRHQLGDDAFYRSMKHYLEANRGKNVVTADLVKAIEETTHTNVDQFFGQWIYAPSVCSAGPGRRDLRRLVALTAQTHSVKQRGNLPASRSEITTAAGSKLFLITVSKATRFHVAADSARSSFCSMG